MKEGKREKESGKVWQKTQYANLVRYVPSGTLYARFRAGGKLVWKSLETDKVTVAQIRLSDLQKGERARIENTQAAGKGKLSLGQAIDIYVNRIEGAPNLKPRTKGYHKEQVKAIRRTWPDADSQDLGKLTKVQCLNWASEFGRNVSPSVYNHTLGILRKIIDLGVEAGARYDNPAKFIKRVPERQKQLKLPEPTQFEALVREIETSGSGFSKPCADLVRFLAFGGFRKGEAANITWDDVDFRREEIIVRGDPEGGTKNGEIRRVPMIPEMRILLEKLKAEREPISPSGPVMAVRECQKALDRACRVAKVTRITHHDLRHLFATRCIESGVDIPTVSRWMGHKDGGALAMRTYGHLRNHHSASMAKKVSFSATPPENLAPITKEAV